MVRREASHRLSQPLPLRAPSMLLAECPAGSEAFTLKIKRDGRGHSYCAARVPPLYHCSSAPSCSHALILGHKNSGLLQVFKPQRSGDCNRHHEAPPPPARPSDVTDDVTNDEESVSNIIAKANKDLDSAMTEGDIKSDGRRNALSCRFCKWPKSGSYVNIFYRLSNSYTSEQKDFIRSVMTGLENKTCIRFKDVDSVSWWKYLRHLSIYPGKGCWSYIGRVWNLRSQSLSLSSGCFTTATVQHELFHALGFTHEHSRSDRDDHVTVHNQNIQSDKLHNFNKYKTNNLYTPYDFNSVMQYHNWAWTSNKKATLTSKENPGLRFGFAKVASDNDILRVNRYYKCNV
uniref:Metalloendopeptidase n=1 Tax=Knipowitschia caucasica TaxID=637954 RepID=A0AAV2L426_KNICA